MYYFIFIPIYIHLHITYVLTENEDVDYSVIEWDPETL